jgi:hypothetical protein
VIVDDYLFRPPPPVPTHGRRVFTFDPNAFRPKDE